MMNALIEIVIVLDAWSASSCVACFSTLGGRELELWIPSGGT
jgi:hypothetical protein